MHYLAGEIDAALYRNLRNVAAELLRVRRKVPQHLLNLGDNRMPQAQHLADRLGAVVGEGLEAGEAVQGGDGQLDRKENLGRTSRRDRR